MKLSHSISFLQRYLEQPRSGGAIAPSSSHLCGAVCEPFRKRDKPARVHEAGAGTGAVTRVLGRYLGPEDRLDVCEIAPSLADIVERDVLTMPCFRRAVAEGRVRLLRRPAQDLGDVGPYDYIVSGLPFTAFELDTIKHVFDVMKRSLKPDGVFSYYEYVGLRRTSAALAVGKNRQRARAVSSFMTETIREHQFARHTVLGNLPPAHARHLRFNGSASIY